MSRHDRLLLFPRTTLLLAILGFTLFSGGKPSPRIGLPFDWTHRYVVFSESQSAEVMAEIQNDPRYWLQKIRMEGVPVPAADLPERPRTRPARPDWSVTLGGAGSFLGAGQYPAKYNFNVNSTPDCTNDYVVYALNVTGSATQATIVAYNNLYTNTSGTGLCSPPCLGGSEYEVTSLAHPIIDALLVDSSTQRVFAFVGNNAHGQALVVQADTQLSGFGPEAPIGQGGMDIFDGYFDHNYFTSPQTGFLYVCGYPTSAPNSSPVLYRIGFNSSGVMNGSHDTNSLAVASNTVITRCSPQTAFYNKTAGKDWLFFSVPTGCNATGGGVGGCVMSFDITSGFPSAATQGRVEYTGTSGIVIDNISSQPEASSIYFTTQGNAPSFSKCGDGSTGGGCAVKTTQNGLN